MNETLQRAIADEVSRLAELTPGRTGNLSARRDDRVAITPTGVPYDEIEPADVPVLDLDGNQVGGELAPSSEVPMHLGIYRSMDVGAIVHTHSPWSTTLAVLTDPLPPVHYMVALAGGKVPVADYAEYGTTELAENAVSAMEAAGNTACILANHGLVAAGDDVTDAIETVEAVESTAQVYLQAKSVGEPVELDPTQIDSVVERFESYGQTDRES